MKLSALDISNFRCIGEEGYRIIIDDIVVIIGPNNVGKSSILDAYEAFSGTGSSLPISYFRDENPTNTIRISGIFTELVEGDIEILGKKWLHDDPLFGKCIKVKWEWNAPDQSGKKYSWDPETNNWVPGGMGGWDTLIASRIPVPLRVRPTDDPETTEAQIVDILISAAKAALKKDEGRLAEVKQAPDFDS